jgi:hypothetical protein
MKAWQYMRMSLRRSWIDRENRNGQRFQATSRGILGSNLEKDRPYGWATGRMLLSWIGCSRLVVSSMPFLLEVHLTLQ